MVEPSTKKRSPEAYEKNSNAKQVHLKVSRTQPPIVQSLKGRVQGIMGPEQSEAFQQLKKYMATKLLVTVPEPEAPLLLYVAASDHAISGVLVQEKEEGSKAIQQPIYYISEALSGAKLNYTEIKKITYAVLISSRKLKHYF
jgi:hypothetical protein